MHPTNGENHRKQPDDIINVCQRKLHQRERVPDNRVVSINHSTRRSRYTYDTVRQTVTMGETSAPAPLATLETMLSEPVTVRTNAGRYIHGTLIGYDEHLNLTLKGDTSPADDDIDDDHHLIRGNRVVSITHPPTDTPATSEAATEHTNPEPTAAQTHAPPAETTDESAQQSTDPPTPEPSPALTELKEQLGPKDLTVDIDAQGKTLLVNKLGVTYRIHPDGTVEGDGLHRKQLEQLLSS